MDFLEKVKKCFPSAKWEDSMILPVYILRHGKISGDETQYDANYPFVGYAKRFETEKVSGCDFWNEQLAPWPCFVVLVAKPDDGVPLTDAENDPERTNFFYLIYADENGVIPFQIPKEREDELVQGFKKLQKESITTEAPRLDKSKWFDEMTDKTWVWIQNNGILVSTAPSD